MSRRLFKLLPQTQLTVLYELIAAGRDTVENPGTGLHVFLFRHEILLGSIQQPTPLEGPSGKGGDPRADGRQRALGDPLALVERFAAPDALYEVDVLLIHAVDMFTLEFPRIIA